MKAKEYTHKWLTDNGWKQVPEKQRMRGPGFTEYTRSGKPSSMVFNLGKSEGLSEIVFVGNASFMEAWTEKHWKRMWPEVYKWYIDVADREPHDWYGHILFIKGEDPKLVE